MGKQQRQNAPEAEKAQGAAEKPSEPTNVEVLANAAPEAEKAQGDGAAAGENPDTEEGEELTCPACALVDESRPPAFVPPEGKAHCRAITTCGVRGMPAFAGEEFWYEWHEAEYLESVGALEILNKK